MDLFDLNRKKTYVRGGQTNGRIKTGGEDESESSESESESDDGENEEIGDPWLDVGRSMLNRNRPQHRPGPSTSEALPQHYEMELIESSVNLPINTLREQITETVGGAQVTVITGSTGCGKTTQVPQFLLNWHAARGTPCNIIVVQPRRVSVITVATRVCEERGWEIGGICGYKVGLNSVVSSETRLLYVTTGVFLQILLHKKTISDFTHVIIDEIHEREQVMDFSLLVVKKYMATNSPNTKLILMSATAEVEKFSNFFKSPTGDPAPVLTVKAPALHNVKIFYLDDLELLDKAPKQSYDYPQVRRELLPLCIKLFTQFDVLDYKSETKVAVLVFLPGTGEIDDMYTIIKKQANGPCRHFCKWYPVPIHSALSMEDQARAFNPAPPGYRKIVIATNIAESSITIPDAGIVVDFCLAKIVINNPERNLTKLNMVWASKANLIQRAGRVGRVGNGIVYRLIPRRFMQADIKNHNSPDITRCLLQRTTLQAVMLGLGDPQKFLADALDPPNPSDVKRSVLLLTEMGAFPVRRNTRDIFSPKSLTLLGTLMAIMPVDIELTRMILLGYVFSVFKESIIIVACLSTRGMFANSFRERMKYYLKKLTWANGSCSDCIAALNAYETWKRHQESGYFKRKAGDNELEWAKRHCLDLNSLLDAEKLVNELIARLKQLGIEEPTGPEKIVWPEERREHIIKLVIAGTYYPNYFVYPLQTALALDKNACDDLSGRDPSRTACLMNFPRGENYELYLDYIHEYLTQCDQEYTISTDYDRKLYIEFPKDGEPLYKFDPEIPFDPAPPGGISIGVYKAFKIKFIQRSLEFTTLSLEDAQEKKFQLKMKRRRENRANEDGCISPKKSFPSGIPRLKQFTVPVQITDIINPGQFWCINVEKAIEFGEKLKRRLDSYPKFEPFLYPPRFGQLCVVRNDNEGGALYRAKILFVEVDSEMTEQGRSQRGSQNQQPKSKTVRRRRRRRRRKRKRMEAAKQTAKSKPKSKPELEPKPKPKPKPNEIQNLNKNQTQGRRGNKSTSSQEKKPNIMSWSATVLLIDIGKKEKFKSTNIMKYSAKLFSVTKGIPSLAFECTLAELKASPYKNANNRWVPEATNLFKDLTEGETLIAHVDAVISDVVAVILIKTVHEGDEEVELNINDHLKSLGYAVHEPSGWLVERYKRIQHGEDWLKEKEHWQKRRYIHTHFDIDLSNHEKPVKLGGPFSPLELSLIACTQGRLGSSVGMHNCSVNAVFLNAYCRDNFSKLVAAAVVSLSNNREGLCISNTNAMPRIPGWAVLIPVLFAPVAEIRVSYDNQRYTGALCGLGPDQNGKPIFAEHDMEVMFDVHVSRDDLIDINRIRYSASAMFNKEFFDENLCSHVDRFHFAKIVKECVENVFFKKRTGQGQESPERSFAWTRRSKLRRFQESVFNDWNNTLMFRPHRTYDLETPSSDKAVVDRMKFLHDLVENRFVQMKLYNKPDKIIDLIKLFVDPTTVLFVLFRQLNYDTLDCELCEVTCNSIRDLQSHLLTEGHLNKEADLLRRV